MTGLRQQIDLRPKTFTMSEVVQLMRPKKTPPKAAAQFKSNDLGSGDHQCWL
jgi:hypothetical protein